MTQRKRLQTLEAMSPEERIQLRAGWTPKPGDWVYTVDSRREGRSWQPIVGQLTEGLRVYAGAGLSIGLSENDVPLFEP